jgi:N-acetylglucosaminyldiphosphoundecaprenol N-acetyl-beta-D-mannosaminyltransferase
MFRYNRGRTSRETGCGLKTMSMVQYLDDLDQTEFTKIAAEFGQARFGYVVTPNVDHLIRYHEDANFRAAYADASYVLLDSRFLSYVLTLTTRWTPKVCTGSGLTEQLFRSVINPSDQIVLIGGSESQAAKLQSRYHLQCLRHYNPPMRFIENPEEVEKCLRFVESMSPFRFCLLGVGAPQQEFLAQKLKARAHARGLALCIGASINFLTGLEQRAPGWMQGAGMEWIYRLARDPGRLGRRYLIRGPRVFLLLGKTKLLPRRA